MMRNIIILSVLLSYSACEKIETDSVKPSVKIFSPINGQQYIVNGDTCKLIVNASLSDDIKLSEYKLEVHASAGHGSHTSLLKNALVNWRYDTIVLLSGLKTAEVDLSISLSSASDTGLYHLLLYVTDKSGNESLEERDVFFRK